MLQNCPCPSPASCPSTIIINRLSSIRSCTNVTTYRRSFPSETQFHSISPSLEPPHKASRNASLQSYVFAHLDLRLSKRALSKAQEACTQQGGAIENKLPPRPAPHQRSSSTSAINSSPCGVKLLMLGAIDDDELYRSRTDTDRLMSLLPACLLPASCLLPACLLPLPMWINVELLTLNKAQWADGECPGRTPKGYKPTRPVLWGSLG